LPYNFYYPAMGDLNPPVQQSRQILTYGEQYKYLINATIYQLGD